MAWNGTAQPVASGPVPDLPASTPASTPASKPTNKTAPSDRLLVWAIVAAQFGPPFLFSGVAVALPSMGEQLQMSAVELGLVETTFLASSTAFLLPAGRLADAGDRRSLFKWGLVLFFLLTLTTG